MECNKEEALRCISIGRERLLQSDFTGATKMVQKAKKLDPFSPWKELENEISQAKNQHKETPKSSSGFSFNPFSPSAAKILEQKNEKLRYSMEIQKIIASKTYYEVLEVSTDATEDEIKRSYRKLALQYHPDKNQELGADEAFKVIAEAFSILSDSERRTKYDLLGADRTANLNTEDDKNDRNDSSENSIDNDPEILEIKQFLFSRTTLDLFDIYYNAKMPSGTRLKTYNMGGGVRKEESYATGKIMLKLSNIFFRLLPLVLLFCFSIGLFVPSPLASFQTNLISSYASSASSFGSASSFAFSSSASAPFSTLSYNDLQQPLYSFFPAEVSASFFSSKPAIQYKIEKTTLWNHVPYFVTADFDRNYGGIAELLWEMEKNVENRYLDLLKRKCKQEQNPDFLKSCLKLESLKPVPV